MAMIITEITVHSDESGAVEAYTISIDPVRETARCNCPAFKYAPLFKYCKHIEHVAAAIQERA